MSVPTLAEMSHADRCALIDRVLRKMHCETTWDGEYDGLGAHLVYLTWAIVACDGKSHSKWTEEYHLGTLNLFRKWFPAEDPVWRFIQTKEGQS